MREPILPDDYTREDDPRPPHQWHAEVLLLLARQLGYGCDYYYPLIGAAQLIEQQQRDLQQMAKR